MLAASLGWMLDSFDVNLYALVLVSLMPSLGIDRTTAGSIASITLLVAALGGLVFGVIADRYSYGAGFAVGGAFAAVGVGALALAGARRGTLVRSAQPAAGA